MEEGILIMAETDAGLKGDLEPGHASGFSMVLVMPSFWTEYPGSDLAGTELLDEGTNTISMPANEFPSPRTACHNVFIHFSSHISPKTLASQLIIMFSEKLYISKQIVS